MPWPATTTRLADGRLAIGGVALPLLAERYGTPLYVYDEATLRANARAFVDGFAAAWPRSRAVYAAKAGASLAILGILREEGVGLDVVSGGELFAGLAAGVPAAAMTFHGNNKGEAELREALAAEIGLIAVDNLWEIELLSRLTAGGARRQPVLLRLNPAVAVETHAKMNTGALDSKFGFPIATGAAADSVAAVLAVPSLDLAGYHAHVGSQVRDPAVTAETIERVMEFAAGMRDRHGVAPRVVSPGGGFGVADDGSDGDVDVATWAATAAAALSRACERHRLPPPELVVEPGRAIVAAAGVALYRVGSRKEIPGVRTYVSVDGGMADNVRPTLYGARYSAVPADRGDDGPRERVAIAGKYCESGDVLIEEIDLPRLAAGDLLAVPMAGAYCLAMASNYNLATRPAAVLVGDGAARPIRRRETYADLLAAEVPPVGDATGGPAEARRAGRRVAVPTGT